MLRAPQEDASTPLKPGDGPILNVVGDLVALGPLHRGVVPYCARWMNDADEFESPVLRARLESAQ